jgi:hypothetical protein
VLQLGAQVLKLESVLTRRSHPTLAQFVWVGLGIAVFLSVGCEYQSSFAGLEFGDCVGHLDRERIVLGGLWCAGFAN